MTINQRDLLALYCLHMGIKSPTNIKNHIKQYQEIRDLVGLCCEEIENVQQEEREKGTDGTGQTEA